jgi:replicative DNA helicase
MPSLEDIESRRKKLLQLLSTSYIGKSVASTMQELVNLFNPLERESAEELATLVYDYIQNMKEGQDKQTHQSVFRYVLKIHSGEIYL